MFIADIELTGTGYLEFALVWANSVGIEWPVALVQTGKLECANARRMIEQAIEHSNAVMKVTLEQRYERAVVPRN